MIKSIKDNITYLAENVGVLRAIERFLSSRWFLGLLAVFIFVVQAMGWDLVGFAVLALIFVYICLFCKGTNGTVPILCMATFCVSIQNSPAKNASGFHLLGKCDYFIGEASKFYGSPAFIFTAAIFGSMVATALLFRLLTFGDFKRAFSPRGLLIGISMVAVSFLLSGIDAGGDEKANLIFGAVQAATFFFVYLFLSTTLDYDTFSFDYIANVMLAIMFYIMALLAYIYATRFGGFLIVSSKWKVYIFSGWGMSLDFGSYLAMTIPACFYKMLRSDKMKLFWLGIALVATAAIYFTLARGAMIVAGVEILVGLIIAFRERKTRRKVFYVLLAAVSIIAVLLFVLWKTDTFKYFFDYFIEKESTGEAGGDVSSGRWTIWGRYWGYFLENPVFGGGFTVDLRQSVAQFGNPNNGIFSAYSYLAHNLLFQILGSCGIVGVIAMAVHLLSALRVMLSKADISRAFIVLSICGFLAMSLLDTIFFKAQFTFLYLAMLVAIEADVRRKVEKLRAAERNTRTTLEKVNGVEKPRVVFAFVEAGMGHIMPERSLADAFEEKYGERCTVIRSRFFSETNEQSLLTLEESFVREVKKYNRNWVYGYLNMYMMDILGATFLSKIIMDAYVPGAREEALLHMKALDPDMVVSTHWSTNYYAEQIQNNKPLTVTYIPDVQTIPLFNYRSDMTLMNSKRGYDRTLKKYKRRYNTDNLRMVPFAIRKEAFDIPMDKKANRRMLGLDEDKMTIVMFEGGYGLGRMGKIATLLAKKDLPLNVVIICGKNEKLYKKLSNLQTGENCNLIVEGFCDKTLEYLAAADVFLGKSGASSVAEAAFFGLASIITKYATSMERDNAEYYIKDVKNAVKIFSAKRVVEQLEEWLNAPEKLKALHENALAYRKYYGSEASADVLWEMLCKKYPQLLAAPLDTQAPTKSEGRKDKKRKRS